MNGISLSRRPHITQLVGVKPSSLTQWESSRAHGHQMIGNDKGLVNSANLAQSAHDALNTVIDDMVSIRDLIVTQQLRADIRRAEASERADAEKMLLDVKEKVKNSSIEFKQVDFGAAGIESAPQQQGNIMKIEEKVLDELGLTSLNIDDPDIVEKLDASIEKLTTYTDEGRFEHLLKVNKDQSDMLRAFKTTDEEKNIETIEVDTTVGEKSQEPVTETIEFNKE